MKIKLLYTAAIGFVLLSLASCVNERVGPTGPQGPAGQDGVNILGTTFDVVLSFNEGNNYETAFDFPSEVEVFETDAVLIYRQNGTIVDPEGGISIWEPLPYTLFQDSTIIFQYIFDHTFLDYKISINANANRSLINSEFLDNQKFRVVIVPSDPLTTSAGIPYSEIEKFIKP